MSCQSFFSRSGFSRGVAQYALQFHQNFLHEIKILRMIDAPIFVDFIQKEWSGGYVFFRASRVFFGRSAFLERARKIVFVQDAPSPCGSLWFLLSAADPARPCEELVMSPDSCSDAAVRALVIAPSWVGDAVMAEPLLARLAAKTPGIRLDVLAPGWVAPVFSRMPEVGDVMPNPFGHGEFAFMKRRALGRRLRQRAYRRAYILPNSLKSAFVPFFARIPERIGFTGEGRFGFVNVRHRLDRAALPLMVERFAQLAEAPGAPLPRPVPPPRLISTPGQQAATLLKLGLSRPERLVIFCSGAEYGPAKRWPEQHFARLARELSRAGYVIWLMGSGKERSIGEAIATQCEGACRNLCGQTNMTEAIDLIALAQLVVCNDSGLMHVAAALSRPLIALFGSSSPTFTPPLSEKAEVLSLNLACSPCFQRTCPFGHMDCLQKLEPAQVLEHARQHLYVSRFNPHP
jgi:heptosyltransferase-2